MIPFELAEPTSLSAAIELLDPDDEAVRPLAGGTALMLMMKVGVFRPQKLVSLRKIESTYSGILSTKDGLRIGAMTTLGTVERSNDVRKFAPLITNTMRTLSNVRVRNVATVGGALAHGDPHMDLPPVLMALGAETTIVGPGTRRRLLVEELFSGYYETTLAKNELIAEVHVPSQGSRKGWYSKVTTGSADDWPALGIAALLDVAGAELTSSRIAVSAATVKATRARSAEAVLNGRTVSERLLLEAGDAALQDCELIDDARGSVPYKRELLRVYLRRTILAAMRQATAHS
jgi:carbon-monoxide dehydrogenase medium subunit